MARTENNPNDLDSMEDNIANDLSQLDDNTILKVLQSALKDRPAALQSLADWIVPELAYPTSKVMTSRIVGTVKSFSVQKGFGFVTSPEIVQSFGKDIFLSINQISGRGHPLENFPVGAQISFVIVLERGKACAYDIAPLDADPHANGFGGLRSHGDARGYGEMAVPAAVVPTRVQPPIQSYASRSPWPQRYTAPVKKYNAEKRFGFLECKELERMLGKADIFVHASQIAHLKDFQPGQMYSFTLGSDDKGQPMATDLTPVSGHNGAGSAPARVSGRRGAPAHARHTGTVKNYNEQKKFGFLICPELEGELGKADIFVHKSQIEHLLENFQQGEMFSFTLGDDGKGKPMATELVHVSSEDGEHGVVSAGEDEATSGSPGDVVGMRYSAPVKSFFPEKKFGFLECSGELCEIMGRPDIFVHETHIGSVQEFKRGQVYSFTVGVDPKGQLMATDLELEEEGPVSKRPKLDHTDGDDTLL